jgi:hypothetical protein
MFESADLTSLGFVDEKQSFRKKRGYTRRIARSHFGCCCPHREMCRSTQDGQHAICTQELLKPIEEFWNIYREL